MISKIGNPLKPTLRNQVQVKASLSTRWLRITAMWSSFLCSEESHRRQTQRLQKPTTSLLDWAKSKDRIWISSCNHLLRSQEERRAPKKEVVEVQGALLNSIWSRITMCSKSRLLEVPSCRNSRLLSPKSFNNSFSHLNSNSWCHRIISLSQSSKTLSRSQLWWEANKPVSK